MKYKFLGQPDKIFPNMVHGRIYDLMVKENSIIVKMIKGYEILIWNEEIYCPYSTRQIFNKNWKRIWK